MITLATGLLFSVALRDDGRETCQTDVAADQWHRASLSCFRESVLFHDPERGASAAEAMFRDGKADAALEVATSWFESTADAAARRVAGMVYLTRGEYAPAQRLLERALASHLDSGDHRRASQDAQVLAGALMYQELFGDARDAAQLAVREAERGTDARVAIFASVALGKILAEIGDATRARTALWQAREHATRYPAERAWIYLELGMLEYDTGRIGDSAKLLALALELGSRHAVARVTTAALLNLARVERELGRLDDAEAHLRMLDPDRRDAPTARFVTGLVAADRGERADAERLLASAAAEAPTGDYAIDIAVQRGKLAERAGDLGRAEAFYREAIGFLDRLQAGNSLELRPWVLAQRRGAYGALLALLARTGRPEAALAIAEQLHARTWQDALLGHAGPPDAAARVATAHRLNHGTVIPAEGALVDRQSRALLADRDVVLLSDAGSDVWRFHVVDGRIELDRVPSEIVKLVDDWRIRPDDADLAARLGALIPDAAYQPATRPLHIIADGRFVALPFAALRRDNRYLIEARVLVRVPDVAALRCGATRATPRPPMFLGDSRNDLAFARAEVGRLAAALGGTAYAGEQVTAERLESGRDVSLLHLALHADEDLSGPSLLLAHERVTSADIVAMKLAPRLAVLAGCATAASRDLEGWDALSSAFLLNGTRTVIATSRPVREADAIALLRRFYELGGVDHPALALALAQRERIASAITTWAPYAAYGAAEVACEPTPR